MAFSFWDIFLFILKIFAFLYCANEESDDVKGGSVTKTVQHRLSLYYQISKQCSLNLAPELYITKKKKQNDALRAIAMITIMPLVLLKLDQKSQILS